MKLLWGSTYLQHHQIGVAQRQLRLLGRQPQRKLLRQSLREGAGGCRWHSMPFAQQTQQQQQQQHK